MLSKKTILASAVFATFSISSAYADLGAPPAGSAYFIGQQQTYVDDKALDVVVFVNTLLCAMRNSLYDEMLNTGWYNALIDVNGCDSASILAQSAQRPGQEANQSGFFPVRIKSERLTNNSDHVIQMFVIDPEYPDDEAYVQMVIDEAPSAAKPEGVWTAYVSMSDETKRRGLEPLTLLVSSNGREILILANQNGRKPDDIAQISSYFENTVDDDLGQGLGSKRGLQQRLDRDETMAFGSNNRSYCREEDGQRYCFDLNARVALQSSWKYQLYTLNGEPFEVSPGARDPFSIFDQNENRGWVDFNGVWFPDRVLATLESGDPITDALGTEFELVKWDFVLSTRSTEVRPFEEISGLPIWRWGVIKGSDSESHDQFIEFQWDNVAERVTITEYREEWHGERLRDGDLPKWASDFNRDQVSGEALWELLKLDYPSDSIHAWSPFDNGSVRITDTSVVIERNDSLLPDYSGLANDLVLNCNRACVTPQSLEAFGRGDTTWPFVDQPDDNGNFPVLPDGDFGKWDVPGPGINYTLTADGRLLYEGQEIRWPADSSNARAGDWGNFPDGFGLGGDRGLVSDDGSRYEISIGPNIWQKTYALREADGDVVKFADPIFVEYKVPETAFSSYYRGQTVRLRVVGSQIQIPGDCYDRTTHDFPVQCEGDGGDTGWAHHFIIPTYNPNNSNSVASHSLVTVVDETGERGESLWVKWLEREVVLQPTDLVPDMTLGTPERLQSLIAASPYSDFHEDPFKYNPANRNSALWFGDWPSAAQWEEDVKVIHGRLAN